MKNYLNEPNPLNSEPGNRSSGKGSTPRNLSKKFRQNYDQINWGKKEDESFKSKCVHTWEKNGIQYGVWTTPPIPKPKKKKK